MQYKSAYEVLEGNNYANKKISSLQVELDKYEKDKKKLLQKLDDIEEQIKQANNKNESLEDTKNKLNEELDKLKKMSGVYRVSGKGITIKINNPPEDSPEYMMGVNILNKYYYLLGVISNLNSAGAEAISINDLRYTSYTEIIPVADYLNINGKHVTAPIEIKAIGDQRTLKAAVDFLQGIVDKLKQEGFKVEVESDDNIVILGTGKLKVFKYLETYKDKLE